MAHFLASRIAKLEQRARAAKPVVRASVVEFDPTTRKPIGRIPTARRVMASTVWPSDEAWSQALRRQQAELLQHP